MKKLRMAVVGVGHLGRSHARILAAQPGIELLGVVDPMASSREQVAAALKTNAFADVSELLGEIDAAVIATPTAQHFGVASELLAAGIHLLVEKPLSARLDEATELVALARRNGLVLQVGHVERFNPAWSATVPHVRGPKYLDATRIAGFKFRSTDIGVVHDLMIHDLDLVLSLVRSPVTQVDALGVALFGRREDIAQARLTFANGCVATLNASRASFVAARTMQIWSERCFAAIDFSTRTAELVRPTEAISSHRFDCEQLTGAERQRLQECWFEELFEREHLEPEPYDQLTAEIEDFAGSIREGRAPLVSGQQALEALEVADRVLKAIEQHGWDGQQPGRVGPWVQTPDSTLQGPHWLQRAKMPLPQERKEAG